MTGLPVSENLLRLARHAPDAPALVDRESIVTAGEFRARALGCAAWLAAEGCRAGEPVGVTVAGEYANLVVSVALLHLGVPQIALATTDPLALRAGLARRLAVGRIVTDVPDAGLPDIPVSRLAPTDIAAFDAEACAPLDRDPDAPALYGTSSGTTGIPKLFALSQRMLTGRAALYGITQAFAPGERIAVPMSSQRFPGMTMRLYALSHGMSAVLHDGASAGAGILDTVLRTRASMLQLTVLQARGLATDGGATPRLPPAFPVFVGASRMPAGLPRAFEARVGGRIYDRYGTSELGQIACSYPIGEVGVPDSVGRIGPGAEVEVLDAKGRVLSPGNVGELRLRVPWMATRYHDDERATALHYREGWFYPRDVGLVTEDGTLRFLGRLDDMMSLNGINIFPAEIERVLEEHPAVRHAAAFPIASTVHGDIPAAAVELEGDASVDSRALERHAREQLGERAPRKVVIVDALPRNDNGKVLKRELAERYGRARQDD